MSTMLERTATGWSASRDTSSAAAGADPVGGNALLGGRVGHLPYAFFEGDEIKIEASMPKSVLEGLTAKGHKTVYADSPWGGGQIVEMDHANGLLVGASDPRKDGMALGY